MPTKSRTRAPAAAVITSSLAQPQVRFALGLLRIKIAVTVDAAKTEISVNICPASINKESEFVKTDPITSAKNTIDVKAKVIVSLC